jgi:hypothetical protein
MTCVFWALAFLLDTSASSAAVLQYKTSKAPVRPFLFVDDDAIESSDRERPLPSQSRTIGGRVPADPRDYLLRDTVSGTDRGLAPVYAKAAEELVQQQILPVFAKLLRSNLGAAESPLSLLGDVLKAASEQLRARLPEIEAALASGGRPRRITWLVAPWNRTEDDLVAHERYAPGQLGFNYSLRTPTRNFAGKHLLFGGTRLISSGRQGTLQNTVNDWAEWSTRVQYTDEYAEVPHAFPPYAYPVGFLVSLTIAPGASKIQAQLLLGLHPLAQKMALSPADGAVINRAGVPQGGELRDSGDRLRHYPMALATFAEHDLRQPVETVPLHVDFGVFDGYSSLSRRMSLRRDLGAWRMTPYLGGDVTKVQAVQNALRVNLALRIHLTDFDLTIDPRAQSVTMSGLSSAIEVFGRRPDGKLLPGPFNFNIAVDPKSGTATGAAAQIQDTVNQQVKQAIADARTEGRAKTLQKFPMAALFLDPAPAGGAR